MKQYIVGQQDVKGDENCGFRAVAVAVADGIKDTYKDQKLIRQWLHSTLNLDKEKYDVLCTIL
jgi:hypothetical protein